MQSRSRAPVVCGAARVAVLCALLVGCDGKVITLGKGQLTASGGTAGDGGTSSGGSTNANAGGGSTGASTNPNEPLFENVTLIEEIAASSTEMRDENPSLTADMLEMYFFSTRRDSTDSDDDIWVSKRAKVTDAWGAPTLLTPVSTDISESSPAVSADGLSLWIGVELEGGLGKRDVWRFDRSSRNAAFGATPTHESAISTPYDDIPRPLGNRERTMPIASRPDASTDSLYQTYFASRNSIAGTFGTKTAISELVTDGEKLSDGFLSDDGLTFYFVMGESETDGGIFVTTRESLTAPFAAPMALSTINTADYDERDPWVSPDGKTLYFVSTRTNDARRIYRATRKN